MSHPRPLHPHPLNPSVNAYPLNIYTPNPYPFNPLTLGRVRTPRLANSYENKHLTGEPAHHMQTNQS